MDGIWYNNIDMIKAEEQHELYTKIATDFNNNISIEQIYNTYKNELYFIKTIEIMYKTKVLTEQEYSEFKKVITSEVAEQLYNEDHKIKKDSEYYWKNAEENVNLMFKLGYK